MGVTGEQLQHRVKMTEPRKDVKIVIYPKTLRNKPKIMAVGLGCHLTGMVPPICDTGDHLNFRQAVVKRVARETPEVVNKRNFRDVARSFIHSFKPVPAKEWAEYDQSEHGIEYWLSRNKSYSQSRKEEIRKAKKNKLKTTDFQNKAFIKTEFYDSLKFARLINACADSYKEHTGGFVSVIGHWFFKNKCCIKNVPIKDRPKFIMEMLGKYKKILVTDYTSFEAHMTAFMQDSVEMQFYRHMSKEYANKQKRYYMLDTIRAKQLRRQKCTSKLGSYEINATRMSGDMTTSLGNTITNMVIINYIFYLNGVRYQSISEGDDGIIGLSDDAPDFSPKDFEPAGAILKVQQVPSLGKAGFCGQYFDESECESLIDPWYALGTTGWTTANAKMGGQKVLDSLLVAKAYSLAFQAPQNPVTRAFADSILRIKKGIKPRFAVEGPGHISWKDEHIFQGYDILKGELPTLPPRKFTERSYQLVDEIFGMTSDVQKQYVKYFDSVKVIQPIPVFGSYYNKDWTYVYRMNVRTCEAGVDPNLLRYSI